MEHVSDLLYKGFCVMFLLLGLTLFWFMHKETTQLLSALHANLSNPIVVKESKESETEDILARGYHIYYSLQDERDYDVYINGVNRGQKAYLVENIQAIDIELDSEYTSEIFYENGNITRIQYILNE